MSDDRVHEIKLSDEQLDRMFVLMPNDPELITAICKSAMFSRALPTPPNRKGVWPKFDVRVYYDDYGFNASGYMMVHWEDAKAKEGPWLSNGYAYDRDPDFRAENMEWDDSDDAKRQHYHEVRQLLMERAY